MTAVQCPLARRSFLAGSGALFAWAFMPRVASAAGARDPRFLTIVLRGGLDGLSAVPAIGDPDHVRLRRELDLDASAVLPLDGFFALNRSMGHLHRLWLRREATIVHAVATPYRERSHFDGQDVLETGLDRAGGREGWLARALATLPRGERTRPRTGLAVGPATPLILRGNAEIVSWSPQAFPSPGEDTARRLLALYEARDPALAAALAAGMETGRVAQREGVAGFARSGGPDRVFAEQARAAARFMALEDGPRVAAMSFDGWDTHADQGPRNGRLARLLGALDGAVGALADELGPVWNETVVAIVTEFGRTARQNGTEGTDHGTGTIALLVGGAVAGGTDRRRLAGPRRRPAVRRARPRPDAGSARRAEGRAR
jgi:uncharacterized protein (DUF1501 family)